MTWLCRLEAERSRLGALIRTRAKFVSGHTLIDHAGDRVKAKTGYPQAGDQTRSESHIKTIFWLHNPIRRDIFENLADLAGNTHGDRLTPVKLRVVPVKLC